MINIPLEKRYKNKHYVGREFWHSDEKWIVTETNTYDTKGQDQVDILCNSLTSKDRSSWFTLSELEVIFDEEDWDDFERRVYGTQHKSRRKKSK